LEIDGHGAFFRVVDADSDILPEWKEIKFPPVIRRIVSRVTNRVFVGPTLCRILVLIIPVNRSNRYSTGRNPEWRDLNVDFTVTSMKSAMFLSLFPSFIQP